ncbi:MAG UNVERIFIED_CONTAM: NYN domain-containing protein [Planctomycetaceae bacterium]
MSSARKPAAIPQSTSQLAADTWLDDDIAADACVVFDAASAPGPTTGSAGDSDLPCDLPFKVIFATSRPTADDEIEHLLKRRSSPRQVLIVSSDHQLHRAAARRGACCMDSERFLELIESGSPKALRAVAVKRPSRKPGSKSPAEKPPVLRELMDHCADVYEEFQQIDVESLQPPKRNKPSRSSTAEITRSAEPRKEPESCVWVCRVECWSGRFRIRSLAEP